MSYPTRLLAGVSALALALVVSCGGPTEPPPPPPPNPVASITLSGDRIILPGYVIATAGCQNSISASRSWGGTTSSALTRDSIVLNQLSNVGENTLSITCRNSVGKTDEKSAKVMGDKPMFSGKFGAYNAGVGFLGTQRVYVVGSVGTDSVNVNPDGTWSVEVSSFTDTAVNLVSDAKDVGNRRFFRWEISLKRVKWGAPLLYTRVPSPWTFSSGLYASAPSVHPLSLHWDAFNPNSPAGYLLGGGRRQSGCWQFDLQTWPSFPVSLAFDRDRSTDPILPADSIAYWRPLDSLEVELGWDVWRPANFSEMAYAQTSGGSEDWKGVLVRAVNANQAGSYTNGNDVVRGMVETPIWAFSQANNVGHETSHTLRIGHAEWYSMMFSGGGVQDPEKQTLGSRTTAVIQLLYADGNALRALGPGARSGIPGSYMGERRTMGLPVEPICENSAS